MRRTAFCLTFALTLAGAVPPASAQGAQCGDRARIVALLSQTYGETRRSIGLGPNNTVVEVYASDATGTWTITATLPSGLMCLIAAGEGYEAVTEAAPARGTPA
jgi:hypothetical protein